MKNILLLGALITIVVLNDLPITQNPNQVDFKASFTIMEDPTNVCD